MAQRVAGELYEGITGQLFEIGRQLRQPNGYPFNPEQLKVALQNAIEGKFGTVVLVPKEPIREFLNFREQIVVGPLTKRFVPDEFFTTRKGLYPWDDMPRVLRNAKAVESAGTTEVQFFDLTRNVYDREIKAELLAPHVELWQIAMLIEAQKNGEAGPLLTNGSTNIFYVNDYAVGVHWDAGFREWIVRGWEFDDGIWGASDRVFSSP